MSENLITVCFGPISNTYTEQSERIPKISLGKCEYFPEN